MTRLSSRNHWLLGCLLSCVILAIAPATSAAEKAGLPPKLAESVSRGLDFLARQQRPDGSFSVTSNPDGTPSDVSGPPMVTTGTTLLAMLAAGHTPDVGRHGGAVRNAINFLVDHIPDNGYIGTPQGDRGDNSGMVGHGIVTLALAEACGVDPDRSRRLLTRASIARMAKVILTAQALAKPAAHAGGWGATPETLESDLMTTAWNVLALRACGNVGIDVPGEALARAEQFVLRCRNPLDKGFSLQPDGPSQPGATALAIALLHRAGSPAASELAGGREFLSNAAAQTQPSSRRFPVTTAFFVLHAAMLADVETPWRPMLEAQIAAQAPDGGWPAHDSAEEPGRAYATAMTLLTLSAPYQLMPLHLE